MNPADSPFNLLLNQSTSSTHESPRWGAHIFRITAVLAQMSSLGWIGKCYRQTYTHTSLGRNNLSGIEWLGWQGRTARSCAIYVYIYTYTYTYRHICIIARLRARANKNTGKINKWSISQALILPPCKSSSTPALTYFTYIPFAKTVQVALSFTKAWHNRASSVSWIKHDSRSALRQLLLLLLQQFNPSIRPDRQGCHIVLLVCTETELLCRSGCSSFGGLDRDTDLRPQLLRLHVLRVIFEHLHDRHADLVPLDFDPLESSRVRRSHLIVRPLVDHRHASASPHLSGFKSAPLRRGSPCGNNRTARKTGLAALRAVPREVNRYRGSDSGHAGLDGTSDG